MRSWRVTMGSAVAASSVASTLASPARNSFFSTKKEPS